MSKKVEDYHDGWRTPVKPNANETNASVARRLAQWAVNVVPTTDDFALADRALKDTLAVTLAARGHPIVPITEAMSDAAKWATLGHVLDFDDLHLGSTTHISAVIVPTVLASGGDARAYLAGAGVMARLGNALGWSHYSMGWHATCTAGAPAAAIAAGTAMGLSAQQLETAIALAIPSAGGVQAAFGTHAKSLQVGFSVDAGIRAAHLAQSGATADVRAVDDWLQLVGGDGSRMETTGAAVPGGLAIKLFPCCYAMQRPIAALHEIADDLPDNPDEISAVRAFTSAASLQPLVHARAKTGLEGKFSFPYAIATAILDSYSGFDAFEDDAVNRAMAQSIMSRVTVQAAAGGSGLLDGWLEIEIDAGGITMRTAMDQPPGSPFRPPTAHQMSAKFASCGRDVPAIVQDASWGTGAEVLRDAFDHERGARSAIASSATAFHRSPHQSPSTPTDSKQVEGAP
jgi:2-methylcitrate dehydratase PrpD